MVEVRVPADKYWAAQTERSHENFKIGVGIEARLGSCTYKTFSGDLDFSASKIKTSGFRAFIQFRW